MMTELNVAHSALLGLKILGWSSLTIALYWLARKLQQRLGKLWCNPILLSVLLLIGILSLSQVGYQSYQQSTQWLVWLLQPAIVALAWPLYQQLLPIKALLGPILLCCSIGTVLSVTLSVCIAAWLGAPVDILASTAPNAVTTPIAMTIAELLGGIPALAAALVILVGILGAVFGFSLLRLTKVHHPKAQGLAIGCAAHALGTVAALERGPEQGAFSSLALTLCAVITSIITPLLYPALIQLLQVSLP